MYLKIINLSLLSLFLAACSSSSSSPAPTPPTTADSLDKTSEAATYQVTFTGQWTSDFGTVPAGAHFTQLAGSAVRASSSLWSNGQAASAGMEALAEDGTTATFISEIDAEITTNQALKSVTSNSSNTGATGTTSFTVDVNRTYPLFIFATMIAPSPDWFVGQSQFNLLNASGEWKDDETVPLRTYDAGTEDGNSFSRSNPATSPAGVIHRLSETISGGVVFNDGLVNNKAIASVTFTRTK